MTQASGSSRSWRNQGPPSSQKETKRMKPFQRQILRDSFSLSIFLFALLSCNLALINAQETGPKRGFQPGGSYALSDIETISTTNGNLMMQFTLPSLPVGRNGLTAGINLIYNSTIYNSRTSWFQAIDNNF